VAVLAWRAAHDSLECSAEGAFGFVAERERDGGDGIRGVDEAIGGEEHAPAGEVFHGGVADGLFEFEGEDGAGHAGALGELLHGPGMGGVGVDGGDGGGHLVVGEGEEPADTAGEAFCEMQAEGLDEHHGCELLGDEESAGFGLAELAHHAFEGPAHGGLGGLGADMDDGWEDAEEDAGVLAGEGEVAADAEAVAATVVGADVAVGGEGKEVEGVQGSEGEVAGEGEGAAGREEEAVTGLDEDGVGDVVDGEPAVAGDDGVALDAVVLGEADGPGAGGVETADHVGVGLEEGEDVG